MSWVDRGMMIAMPIYVYECSRCHRQLEEIQRYTDPPPADDLPCEAAVERDEKGEEILVDSGSQTCNFERVPTTFTQRWNGDYSNDGRGGWVRQADGLGMVRMTQGKNTTNYGDGHV